MNQLQVIFSNDVELEALQALHQVGLDDQGLVLLKELIHAAGGDKLSPVYELSAEEIRNDKYGFAKSFKLFLKPEQDIDDAIHHLQSSPWIESVNPVGISLLL
ncbi:hypothetical protein [Acaryochloris marina]|uniref:hypothetical protein n=1 Tax=Acaryochloris marina TaxID=155978 RepID=UPI0021C449FB|nr:hypothetical protein [Acaryochloris marina]